MKVKSESEVTQSCPTLSDPMDCSLPGSSAHGIVQARVLEWGAVAFSGCPIENLKSRMLVTSGSQRGVRVKGHHYIFHMGNLKSREKK